MENAKPTGRDAVIDGWRGVSVLMVIAGHFVAYRAKELYPLDALNSFGFSVGSKTFAIVSSLGTLGVCFFFMISGYLITTLLVSEEDKRDRVSLKAFYVRRVFRIMPAFYAYVLWAYLAGRAGLIGVDDEAALRSSLYICNFSGFSCSWWLAHSWSLAVEEQFYLIWPMIFALAPVSRRRMAVFLLAGLVVGSLYFTPLGSFIYIMAGVVIALFGGLRKRLARVDGIWIWVSLAVLIALPAAPRLVTEIAAPIQPALAAMIMFGTLFGRPSGALRQILRTNWLTKIGLASYSLYLWQQMSLAPAEWGGAMTGADTLYGYGNAGLAVAFIPIAIASYFLIEKPMVVLGHRLSHRIMASHTPAPTIKLAAARSAKEAPIIP